METEKKSRKTGNDEKNFETCFGLIFYHYTKFLFLQEELVTRLCLQSISVTSLENSWGNSFTMWVY